MPVKPESLVLTDKAPDRHFAPEYREKRHMIGLYRPQSDQMLSE